MVSKKIKALAIYPGRKTEEIEIEDTLEALQEFVGGDIEEIRCPWASRTYFVLNENGKGMRLPFNFFIPYDFVVGNCLAVGESGENYADITDDAVAKIKHQIGMQW